jgi:tetratricopeptide (TPR) repeat protein
MNTQLKSRTPASSAAQQASSNQRFKHAVHLHQLGDLVQAERLYQELLNEKPNQLQASYLLGLIASQTQRPALAVEYITPYLKQYPNDFQALAILGLAHHDLKHFTESAALLQSSIQLSPLIAHTHYNLGKVNLEMREYALAIAAFDQALHLSADYIEALLGKAQAQRELKLYEAALGSLTQAVMLEPQRAESHFFLGNVLRDVGMHSEAIYAYDTALTIKPNYLEALVNSGSCYKDQEQLITALAQYDAALSIDPQHSEARYNKALALMLEGRFESALPLYEARLESAQTQSKFLGHQAIRIAPDWDGQAQSGRLLVIAEQGLGDQVFFSGLLQYVQQRVTSITVCVEPRLVPLLARSFPSICFIAPEALNHLGDIQSQIYAGSLLAHVGADIDSHSAEVQPWLQADPVRTSQLRQRLKQPGRLLVGISWHSGNADCGIQKSLSLAALEPALCLDGVDFIDLQYGDTRAERAALLDRSGVSIECVAEIDKREDIDGLAALINACDLIITVSNTTAHIAAALGKPTLVMLPRGPGLFWYWHQEGERSPWYPRAMLYRQHAIGDWSGVIDAVSLTLAGVI